MLEALILTIIIFIGIVYFLYKRKNNTVDLSMEQLILLQNVLSKEINNIETEKQQIINQAAKEGKAISITPILEALDRIKIEQPANIELAAEVERQKAELTQKYGTHIPVDEAYRLIKEYESA